MCVLTETFWADRIVPPCYLRYSPPNMDYRGYELALDASLVHNLFIIASSLKKKKSHHLYFSPHFGTKAFSPHITLVL